MADERCEHGVREPDWCLECTIQKDNATAAGIPLEEVKLRDRIQNRGEGAVEAMADYIYESCLLDMNGPMGLAALAVLLVREGMMDGKPINLKQLIDWAQFTINTGEWQTMQAWVEEANAGLRGDDDAD